MKKLFIAASLFFCGLANASLVDHGTTTTDTATGYVWMDLTQTTAYSYNQMQSNFLNPGSQFFGYNYAKFADLSTLWNDAGYVGNFYDISPASAVAIANLVNLFGQTGTNCCARADGMFNDEDSNPAVSFASLIPEPNVGRVANNRFSADQVGWTSENQLGSWIYKAQDASSVPEPSGIALLGLGLLGLIVSRKKAHPK